MQQRVIITFKVEAKMTITSPRYLPVSVVLGFANNLSQPVDHNCDCNSDVCSRSRRGTLKSGDEVVTEALLSDSTFANPYHILRGAHLHTE